MALYTKAQCVEVARLTALMLLDMADPTDELQPGEKTMAALAVSRTVEGLLASGVVVPGEREL